METQNHAAVMTVARRHLTEGHAVVKKVGLSSGLNIRPTREVRLLPCAQTSDDSLNSARVLHIPKTGIDSLDHCPPTRTSTSASISWVAPKPTASNRSPYEQIFTKPSASKRTRTTHSSRTSTAQISTLRSTRATLSPEQSGTLYKFANYDSTDESELSETYSEDFDDTREVMRPRVSGNNVKSNKSGGPNGLNAFQQPQASDAWPTGTDTEKKGAEIPASKRNGKRQTNEADMKAKSKSKMSKVPEPKKTIKETAETKSSTADGQMPDRNMLAGCKAKRNLPEQSNVSNQDVKDVATWNGTTKGTNASIIANLRKRYFLDSDLDSGTDDEEKEQANVSIGGPRKRLRL